MLFAHKVELFIGEQRCKVLERHTVAHQFRRCAVDSVHAAKREIFFTFARRTNVAFHYVAGLEAILLNLRLRHIHIIGRGKVVIVR